MRVYDYHSYTILNFKAGRAVLDYNNDDKRELHIQDTRREKGRIFKIFSFMCCVPFPCFMDKNFNKLCEQNIKLKTIKDKLLLLLLHLLQRRKLNQKRKGGTKF